jgi:glycerol-3-phosphate dehydrogenase (NAD(P)+)
VAEGVPTASVAAALCKKHDLDLPIFRTVELLLSGKITTEEAHMHLMGRPIKAED